MGFNERENVFVLAALVVHFINDLADEVDSYSSYLPFVSGFVIGYMRRRVKSDAVVRKG